VINIYETSRWLVPLSRALPTYLKNLTCLKWWENQSINHCLILIFLLRLHFKITEYLNYLWKSSYRLLRTNNMFTSNYLRKQHVRVFIQTKYLPVCKHFWMSNESTMFWILFCFSSNVINSGMRIIAVNYVRVPSRQVFG
jgi:hypothetical protein